MPRRRRAQKTTVHGVHVCSGRVASNWENHAELEHALASCARCIHGGALWRQGCMVSLPGDVCHLWRATRLKKQKRMVVLEALTWKSQD